MTSEKQIGTGFSLKDALFNRDRVKYLAGLFKQSDPNFNARDFERSVMRTLPSLELKERIQLIADQLGDFLSPEFPLAARQIVSALPPPLDPQLQDNDFGDFIFSPLGEFVAQHGLSQKYLKTSFRTLKEITQRFSVEYAIRPFLNQFPDETLKELTRWSEDKNYHVRRLVSEGTRPFLPWGSRISLDVTQTIPLLNRLHADSTRYVTRSVANHLNDISKIRPELVVDTIDRWQKEGTQNCFELAWMTKHALRTLVKQGNPDALSRLGFASEPQIKVSPLKITSVPITVGESLEFSFDVHAGEACTLLIDYVIQYVKANGSLAPKVHKLKMLRLQQGEKVTVRKRHPFRKNATTRTYYPGVHHLQLQINGTSHGSRKFHLVVDNA